MSEKRGAFARIGIVLLNLLAIGLGLLRLGRWQMAVVLFGVSALILIFLNFAAPFPIALLLTAVISWVAAYILAFWLSWRFSKTRQVHLKWYQRWYTVVIACITALAISAPLTNRNHLRYRSFYIPSESMAPTLEKNDRLFAYMRPPQQLHRGDLVLVTAPGGTIYIKRIAALPDDRISMSKGVVILNDVPVPQRMVDKEMVEDGSAKVAASRLLEQFPGETRAHTIYDLGSSAVDDLPQQTVQPGHIFVLGDNRDDSADSRVSRDFGGLDQVPISDIRGFPLYFSWGSSRPIGAPIR